MNQNIKIAIIGNYNFAYHSHNATNKAIQHAEIVLDCNIDYYWINENEFCEMSSDTLSSYDGFVIAPGPFEKPFFLQSILTDLFQKNIPVLGTGEIFKLLVEWYFTSNGIEDSFQKIISDNLVTGNLFNQISLDKFSSEFEKLYIHRGPVEFSFSRYSILPQYSDLLAKDYEIGARNEYFDPEILKHKKHVFFTFTMFCPQMNSTEDIPHPIFLYFVKNVIRLIDIKETNASNT